MRKLIEVQQAKELMEEAAGWSTFHARWPRLLSDDREAGDGHHYKFSAFIAKSNPSVPTPGSLPIGGKGFGCENREPPGTS